MSFVIEQGRLQSSKSLPSCQKGELKTLIVKILWTSTGNQLIQSLPSSEGRESYKGKMSYIIYCFKMLPRG